MSAASRDSTRTANQAAEPPAPSHIDARFHVIQRLGHGGVAVVYRVRERNCARELALKQLSLRRSRHDRELTALFDQEQS